MKKLARIAGDRIANTELGRKARTLIAASGGSIAGMAFILTPALIPAPLRPRNKSV